MLFNDQILTTVLIDPWQQRTWKFRLPKNEGIFQNLLRAGKVDYDAFDAYFKPYFGATRVLVYFNPETESHFGWVIEMHPRQSPLLSSRPRDWIKLGDKQYARFRGPCLLYCPDWYYREPAWPAFLGQIQWQRPSDFRLLDFGLDFSAVA